MNWVFWALIIIFLFAIWLVLTSVFKNFGKLIFGTYNNVKYTMDEEEQSYYSYVVKDGDTLEDIAERFHTTEERLLKDNCFFVKPDVLKPGERIKIIDYE